MSFEAPALTWAQHYLEQGFSVIPVDEKSKKARVKWQEHQKRLATDQELKEWFESSGKTGMAIITGGLSQICVIDVDSHKHPGAIEKIKPYLPPEDIYPIAQSQSGGWHLYFKCNGELRGGTNIPFEGVDLRANGNYIIVPPTPGYTWKRKIEDDKSNLIELSSSYLNILSSTSSRSAKGAPTLDSGNTGNNSLQPVTVGFDEGSRDQTLFHLANFLVKGGMHQNNIWEYLNFFASKCDPPFPENEIESKIKSAFDRSEGQDRSIQAELYDWISVTSGYWSVTEAFQLLPVLQKHEKQAARTAISRFVKEGLLEKHPTRAAVYRRVENQIEEIDWKNASTEAFDIRFPFEIEKYVRIHPGDLVAIAGEPDSGKTAFMLNLVKLNQNRGHEIYYASSEFGGEALKGRLPGFKDIPLEDWNFHFFNRADEFQDIIKPDAINLIDYLEISDSFYQIAGKFKAIHDKLKTGIAIVALQKDPKAAQGRGGSFSIEKPALYLNIMDNYPAGQKIQILKAKDWADKLRNPKWLELDFKIYTGCILAAVGDWYHPTRPRK